MKQLHNSVAVRREIAAAKTHVTDKQINDRIKVIAALCLAGAVATLIVGFCVFFNVSIN